MLQEEFYEVLDGERLNRFLETEFEVDGIKYIHPQFDPMRHEKGREFPRPMFELMEQCG